MMSSRSRILERIELNISGKLPILYEEFESEKNWPFIYLKEISLLISSNVIGDDEIATLSWTICKFTKNLQTLSLYFELFPVAKKSKHHISIGSAREFNSISDYGLEHLGKNLGFKSSLQKLSLSFKSYNKFGNKGINLLLTNLGSPQNKLEYFSFELVNCAKITGKAIQQGATLIKNHLNHTKGIVINIQNCPKVAANTKDICKNILADIANVFVLIDK